MHICHTHVYTHTQTRAHVHVCYLYTPQGAKKVLTMLASAAEQDERDGQHTITDKTEDTACGDGTVRAGFASAQVVGIACMHACVYACMCARL